MNNKIKTKGARKSRIPNNKTKTEYETDLAVLSRCVTLRCCTASTWPACAGNPWTPAKQNKSVFSLRSGLLELDYRKDIDWTAFAISTRERALGNMFSEPERSNHDRAELKVGRRLGRLNICALFSALRAPLNPDLHQEARFIDERLDWSHFYFHHTTNLWPYLYICCHSHNFNLMGKLWK